MWLRKLLSQRTSDLALTARVAGEGDTDAWHYDTNDIVFSILLQAPTSGGEFEYVPYLRSEHSENYAAVAALFSEPRELAQRPGLSPGDLNLFRGDLSMHRVTPVDGGRRRILALFGYDREPGMTFEQSYIDELEQGLPDLS